MYSTEGPLDIDRLMREIRADIAARLPVAATPIHDDARDAGPNPDDAGVGSTAVRLSRIGEFANALTRQSSYRLDDFLAYHDEDFIRNAYRALLGREPDAEGASRYLVKIRSGALSRTEVLGRIRFSPEGKAGGVRVDGLLLPFAVRSARRVPVVGRLLGIVQYAWRLPDLARNHEMLESAMFANRTHQRSQVNGIVSEIEQALAGQRSRQLEDQRLVMSRCEAVAASAARLSSQLEAVVGGAARLSGQLETVDQSVRTKADLTSVTATFGEVRSSLLDLEATAQTLSDRMTANEGRLRTGVRELEVVRDANQQLGQQFARLVPALDFTTIVASTERATGDLGRIANALEDVRAQLRSDGLPLQHAAALDAVLEQSGTLMKRSATAAAADSSSGYATNVAEGFYVSFEDRFRGTREDIKQRIGIYLPLVLAAGAGGSDAPILDIGCGRGEWLELLHEHELAASGVDMNAVAVAGCRARGLPAIEADGIDHLRRLPANSLGAVSAIHVIEHLPFARLIALFDAAQRALRAGGVIICETPNPENLVVGACSFYNDPTHARPLPPEPFRFILESRGFEQVEIMRLHPDEQLANFPEAPGDASRVIAERLFGPRDYALIGHKA